MAGNRSGSSEALETSWWLFGSLALLSPTYSNSCTATPGGRAYSENASELLLLLASVELL